MLQVARLAVISKENVAQFGGLVGVNTSYLVICQAELPRFPAGKIAYLTLRAHFLS